MNLDLKWQFMDKYLPQKTGTQTESCPSSFLLLFFLEPCIVLTPFVF